MVVNRRPAVLGLAGLLAGGLMPGCSAFGGPFSDPGPVESGPSRVLELGPHLSVEVSAEWSVRSPTAQSSNSCDYDFGGIRSDSEAVVTLQASPDCEGSVAEGNGTPFTFGNAS